MKIAKQTMTRSKKYTILAIVGALVVAGGVTAYLLRDTTDATEETTTIQPAFTFDQAKAPNWMQGATNETSMAVFGKADTDGCFISAEYKPGEADATAEIAAINKDNGDGNYTPRTAAASKMLSLDTSHGTVQYELHQIDFTPEEGAEPVKAGFGVGFAQLTGHYVELKTNCDAISQRADTYDALQAVVLQRE